MSFRLLVIALLSAATVAPGQTEAPQPPAGSAVKPSPDDEKFRQIIGEIQQLHARQKFFEALEKLHQAEELRPNDPIVSNVRGSIYTGMRDFEKAREAFVKAGALNPTAFEPRFNLTELDYVTGSHKEAEAGFTKLLADFPKLQLEVRHLTQFKILVCQLKQDKVADAEKSMKAFTFMDDTAAYYFAKAAFAFHKGDKAEAADWVAKAQKIFKEIQTVPYLDTLMEARWIPSLTVPDDPKK